MKKILIGLFLLTGVTVSGYAQTYIEDAGKVLKSTEKIVQTPYNADDFCLGDKVVMKVELIEKKDERYVMRTVKAIIKCDGRRITDFTHDDISFYQKMYGGKKPAYTYDN
jgi:hypothetical protein